MNNRATENDTALTMSPPKESPVIKVVATVTRNRIICILDNFISRV